MDRSNRPPLQLPEGLARSISALAHSQQGLNASHHANNQPGSSEIQRQPPDVNGSHGWVEFHTSDGHTLFYNSTTQEILYEDPGDGVDSNMDVDTDQLHEETPGGNTPELRNFSTDEFNDEDINAAFHLVNTTSAFDTSEGPTPPGQSAPESAEENFPPIPSSSHATHISTAPAFNQLVLYGSHQSLNLVESDTESVPRFTTAEKAKQKVNPNVLMSGDESMPGGLGSISDEDEMVTGCTTPTPRAVAEDRPMTIADINQLCDSIRVGQKEMAQMIIDGLRPGRSTRSGFHDSGNDGDVEEDYPRPAARKTGAPNRRSALENRLSRQVRDHMRRLITPENLLRNTVHEEEANIFNPDGGACCDAIHFRVHLKGTTHDAWNKSAIGVFVNDFLTVHPEYPSQQESVSNMVRMKSFATLDTLIRKYRESNIQRTEEEKERKQLEKNRDERRRKVSPSVPVPSRTGDDQPCQLYHNRRSAATSYQQLRPHLDLLEQLGVAGMSNDEERAVGYHTQYEVIVPAWRADRVTAWLRIFDAFHFRARKHDNVYGDHSSPYYFF